MYPSLPVDCACDHVGAGEVEGAFGVCGFPQKDTRWADLISQYQTPAGGLTHIDDSVKSSTTEEVVEGKRTRSR